MGPRCSVYIATSLDGFIAREDGAIDWLSRVERPGEDYGYARFFASVDALILGRKTYETARSFSAWPYEGKQVLVMTHRPIQSLHGEQARAGSPRDVVANAAGARRIYVDGGDVVRQFLGARLITDLTISVVPVLLGRGIRLFGALAADIDLEIVASRAFESGLVQTEYRVRNAEIPVS